MDFIQWSHRNVPPVIAQQTFENQRVRFFLAKSFSDENVVAALEHCAWATNARNESLYSDLFKKGFTVILFFSVNGSSRFMGYARISSVAGASRVKKNPFKLTSGKAYTARLFDITWIRVVPILFQEVLHLHNSLNKDGGSVKNGRDGQAIDVNCARDLCRFFEAKFLLLFPGLVPPHLRGVQLAQPQLKPQSAKHSTTRAKEIRRSKAVNVKKIDVQEAKIATQYNPAIAIFPVDLSNISYIDYIKLYNISFSHWNPPEEEFENCHTQDDAETVQVKNEDN